jgi:hypothetical protein
MQTIQQKLRFVAGGAALVALGVAAGWLLAAERTWILPPLPLYASATDSTDSFVVATGAVGEETEGVFFLDALSGDLQCTAFNPTARAFNVWFARNVAADLQLDVTKRPRYLMVTAQIRSTRLLGQQGTGGGIVYVVDAASGKFAAYGVPWRDDLFNSGRPQQGDLVLLHVGSARTATVRE